MKAKLYIVAAMLASVSLWTSPMTSWAEPTEEIVEELIIEEDEYEYEYEYEDVDLEEAIALAEVTEAYACGPGVEIAEAEVEAEEAEAELRQYVIDYALQFVGNRYVAGGNDPNTGADCSGFVKYVLQHAAGIELNRSSREQAKQGTTVSAEEMQPGDLVFYGNGSKVNHVAMYIGDGKIVHASTEKTGIKVSSWDYRSPIRIASFLE